MKTSERFDIRPFGKSYSDVYFLNGKGRCLLSVLCPRVRIHINFSIKISKFLHDNENFGNKGKDKKA